MNRIKLIKTEEEYADVLQRMEALMDAAPGSPEADELELLALLVDRYEAEHFPIDMPDPVEAILFRMDQQGLSARDMEAYLGSQSKVSEVLNRKRPLSLRMIRNLHQGLGIPLEVLVQPPPTDEPMDKYWQFEPAFRLECKNYLDQELQQSLFHWQTDLFKQEKLQHIQDFRRERLDRELFTKLAALSAYSTGPQMAGELLRKYGVHLVVRKMTLPCTLDGGCFLSPSKPAVIGLTLQNDRLEDFWLTLLHLLAQLYIQRSKDQVACFASLSAILADKSKTKEESLADEFLRHALKPPADVAAKVEQALAQGNQEGLRRLLEAPEVNPLAISCWLRLEGKPTAGFSTEKRVSEKLEVYG